MGFHYPYFIKELGPPSVFYGGHFEKSLIVFVKKTGKRTQRQRKLFTQQLGVQARNRAMFEDFRRSMEEMFKQSRQRGGIGGKTGYPVKTRLFGTCYNLTPDGLDGDAKSFFGSSGSLAVQAANVEGDSDEISRELMGMALAETPQLECFPSLSLIIPKNSGLGSSSGAVEGKKGGLLGDDQKLVIHGTRDNKTEDWVNVMFSTRTGERCPYPSQIQCFFQVKAGHISKGNEAERIYAVVRCLGKLTRNRTLRLEYGALEKELYIVPVASIEGIALVSRDVNHDENYWWVLPDRTDFPDILHVKNFAENSLKDDIQREAACDEAADIVEEDSGCDEDGDDFNSDCDYEESHGGI